MPRLEVLVGPDRFHLEPAHLNDSQHPNEINTEHFAGRILVRILDAPGAREGEEGREYFKGALALFLALSLRTDGVACKCQSLMVYYCICTALQTAPASFVSKSRVASRSNGETQAPSVPSGCCPASHRSRLPPFSHTPGRNGNDIHFGTDFDRFVDFPRAPFNAGMKVAKYIDPCTFCESRVRARACGCRSS